MSTVTTPVVSPPSGPVPINQTITITSDFFIDCNEVSIGVTVIDCGGAVFVLTQTIDCNSIDGDIYYTTDGSTPSSIHGTLYATPFHITAATTVKAIGVLLDSTDSDVVTDIYTVYSPIGGSGGSNMDFGWGFEF